MHADVWTLCNVVVRLLEVVMDMNQHIFKLKALWTEIKVTSVHSKPCVDQPDMYIHDPTSHLKMVLHAAASMRSWYNRSSDDLNMASYQKCVSAMGREVE